MPTKCFHSLLKDRKEEKKKINSKTGKTTTTKRRRERDKQAKITNKIPSMQLLMDDITSCSPQELYSDVMYM